MNSDYMVTQLWNPIILKKLKNGGDMFSETSVQTRATRQNVRESIYNLYRRKKNPRRQSSPTINNPQSMFVPLFRSPRFTSIWNQRQSCSICGFHGSD
jgi:hypothetical protein